MLVVILERIGRLRDQAVPHEEREPVEVWQYLASNVAA